MVDSVGDCNWNSHMRDKMHLDTRPKQSHSSLICINTRRFLRVGKFTYLITDIVWRFLQRIPSNVLAILLVTELWSVIFFVSCRVSCIQSQEEINNGWRKGQYDFRKVWWCLPRTIMYQKTGHLHYRSLSSVSYPSVGNSNLLLEKSSRSEKLVNILIWIKIPNIKSNFIIYRINQISCVSFANESLQGFDEMGKQRSGRGLWLSCG